MLSEDETIAKKSNRPREEIHEKKFRFPARKTRGNREDFFFVFPHQAAPETIGNQNTRGPAGEEIFGFSSPRRPREEKWPWLARKSRGNLEEKCVDFLKKFVRKNFVFREGKFPQKKYCFASFFDNPTGEQHSPSSAPIRAPHGGPRCKSPMDALDRADGRSAGEVPMSKERP